MGRVIFKGYPPEIALGLAITGMLIPL